MNDKLKLFLVNLALCYSPFGAVDGKWDSSALELEQQLTARGIKLPIKLFHKYKLPQNMTPQEFMMRLAVAVFIVDDSDVVTMMREIWGAKDLSFKERWQLARYIKSEKPKQRKQLRNWAREIRELNPELANIKLPSEEKIYGLVCGATFGFGPAEIEYFINRDSFDMQNDKKVDRALQSFGITSHYVLAPETAKMVIAALQQNMQNKNGGRVVM